MGTTITHKLMRSSGNSILRRVDAWLPVNSAIQDGFRKHRDTRSFPGRHGEWVRFLVSIIPALLTMLFPSAPVLFATISAAATETDTNTRHHATIVIPGWSDDGRRMEAGIF